MKSTALPAVLNETDVYREFAPPAWARESIACFWVRHGDGRSVRVLPDACTDVVWREGWGATIAGPDTGAWFSPTSSGGLIVGARLRPGAGGVFGVPLDGLRDLRVPVEDLGLGRLRADLAPDEAPAAVFRFALDLVAATPPDPAVRAATKRLDHHHGRLPDLAAALGLSERQLRRRFLATVGYGPKTLQRVLRLRRFLADDSPGGLARAALTAGYADQAHLSRECSSLTGMTPGEIASAARSRGRPQRSSRKTTSASAPTAIATR